MENIENLLQDFTAQHIAFCENEPMKNHCTFKIGGPARVFCRPENEAKLMQAFRLCAKHGVRCYLLGRGSNVLFADEGFAGVVLCAGAGLDAVHIEGTRLIAGAGAQLGTVCGGAAAAGLTGLEFAFGIPGTVGGAVYMNAGAYGGEICDVLESVRFLDAAGEIHTLAAAELCLGYRTSCFEKQNWAILSATFLLKPGSEPEIRALMADYARRRAEKQPLEMPSAGSTFKRPQGAFAGALIEQCGLRGYRVGGAQISEKHCGFVVNSGGATCADVLALTEAVCAIVKEKTGFVLEKEIRVVR